MQIVPNFEAACKITGDDPNNLPDVSRMPEHRGKATLALIMLDIIATAQNKGAMPDGCDFVPDFSNHRQLKYFPVVYFNPSLGRFVCTGTLYTRTGTGLGARFYFKDDDTAEAMGKKYYQLLGDLAPPIPVK
jgi:hypothetical protein